MTLRKIVAALAPFLLALTGGSAARAGAVADFYQGKHITMLVSAAPGPAYDLFARMPANHMGQYIPGRPGFLARNMPGADGMVAANFAYTQGARDGTLIFTLHFAPPLQQALGQNGVRFDARKLIGMRIKVIAGVLDAPPEAIARLKEAMVNRSGGRCEEYSGAASCAKKSKKKKSQPAE